MSFLSTFIKPDAASCVPPPRSLGYHMPAEWEEHEQCWMIWPERLDNWRLNGAPAQAAYAAVAAAIARYEPVTMLASAGQHANARAMLPEAVRVIEMSSNDAWARDVGPGFLLDAAGELAGVDWPFNAWGGGLYARWDDDDAIAGKILALAGARRFAAPRVVEGGALHVDGQGTVLTTVSCLLDEHRNPGATRQDMELLLKDYLGAEQVIWLQAGIPGDETGGHIDNLACFAAPGRVLLSWCADESDPHHGVSRAAQTALRGARDARGRPLEIICLPMPTPTFIAPEEAAGIAQVASGMNRAAGTRLAASYVNFYIANGAIIAPAFGSETDAAARAVLAETFPDRDIVMLPAREILLGGGNIHCITQQQPERRPI